MDLKGAKVLDHFSAMNVSREESSLVANALAYGLHEPFEYLLCQ